MVCAELIHNPYLLSTTVKFNGQAPRINSQIEKYENRTFTDWVNRVPQIFYEEMNGYDFDLNFTGTVQDFEEMTQAFLKAGVSQEQVRLFLKNELECADTKCQEIETLITWLREHKNRKFNFNSFYTDNEELFGGTYSCIVIRGAVSENFDEQISVETVESTEELRGTLLTNTPILFFVEEKSIKQFRSDLIHILQRKDVCEKQLFFMFHPCLNAEQTTRVICDLGVSSPQIVSSIADESIRIYIRNYPVMEYIRESIRVFEETVSVISGILDRENKESELINAGIHAQIEYLEANICRLKLADEFFSERDNFSIPANFVSLLESFQQQIRQWRNRKTKVVGDHESEVAARDYDTELSKYMISFTDAVREECQTVREKIWNDFIEHYTVQGLDVDYRPSDISFTEPELPVIPSLVTDFLGLIEITYEQPKNDLFNLFLKTESEEKQPVRVATCYFEHWRNKAFEILQPIAGQFIQECTNSLRQYYDILADTFHIHIAELLAAQMQEKETVSEQLSDDERKLQEDNDWLNKFKDQLLKIERG